MSFLKSSGFADTQYVIDGDDICLKAPQMGDFANWALLRAQSRAFLRPWEPTWPRDDLSRGSFRRRIRHYQRDIRSDYAYPFFIFNKPGNAFIGGITLGNIRRGVAQSATIGYWVGERHARKGYMSTALPMLVEYAFSTLNLHRIEAACLPENTASIRLLKKCGFRQEGYARRYLRINGAWRDHVLFALLADDAVS